MRCLVILPSLRRAGAETQAIDLANGLVGRGHTVSIFCFELEMDQRDRVDPRISVHHVLRKRKFDLRLATEVAKILDRDRIEIVHGVMQMSCLLGWLAIQKAIRKPHLVSAIHTTQNRSLKEELLDRLLYRWVLRGSSAVVFVCRHQMTYWTAKFGDLRRNSHVVYNGVDEKKYNTELRQLLRNEVRREQNIAEDEFVFTCIAGFRPEKGHNLLIDSFAELEESSRLFLAGDGGLKPAVVEQVRHGGLTDRVCFLGSVTDVRPILAATDATVLASTSVETFSIAMLESMAMGVPMIAPRIGGLHEAISDGETGLLFQVGDRAALVDCMQRLEMNRLNTQEMGTAARERVVQHLTVDQMVCETEQLYLGLAASQ